MSYLLEGTVVVKEQSKVCRGKDNIGFENTRMLS